jgi:hypothetical protein
MLATDISATNCLNNWVHNVSPTGTFVKSKDATWNVTGSDGIPEGWTVVTADYITIEPLEDNFQIQFNNNCNAQYSLNKGSWTSFENDNMSPVMNVGDKLYVKGELESGLTAGQFYTTQSFNLSGNCNSLIFGDNVPLYNDLTGYNYCYNGLFENCSGLKNVSENFLPATTSATHCYSYMFYGCTSLVNAPELPATKLHIDCYYKMFQKCTSLVDAPELPATELSQGCYESMFYGCTSLTTAPELPATTLANSCY